MSGAPYVPVEVLLGPLPEFHEEQKEYDLTGVPGEAKEILVYTFITVEGEKGYFQRGYYEISTTDGATQYKQYMNVATGENIPVVNSANLWLPMGKGKLTVKLFCPNLKSGPWGKSMRGTTSRDVEWSGVFIIGYRA